MVNTEFPFRSYNELVQILTIYNGSNELEMVRNFPLEDRIKYSVGTEILKSPPPHNYSITKGYINAVLHRKFVEYGVLDQRAKDLLKWLEDIWIPDEL